MYTVRFCSTHHVNWRFHFLEVLLRQDKDQEAWQWATSDAMRETFQGYKARKPRLDVQFWTLALIEFRLGKKRGFVGQYLQVCQEIVALSFCYLQFCIVRY